MAGALSSGAVLAKEPEHGSRFERRAELKQWRQQMEEQVKAQDAELDKLLQQIDSASGQQKIDAVASAVKTLIQQRKTMHSQMESFRERMQKERGGAQPESGTQPSPGGSSGGQPTP